MIKTADPELVPAFKFPPQNANFFLIQDQARQIHVGRTIEKIVNSGKSKNPTIRNP